MQHNKVENQERWFPHESLAAYRYSLTAVRFVAARRAKLRGLPGRSGPQLEAAVVGAHTNLCAGAATRGVEAKRHYRIALTEAGEAGGALDPAFLFGALSEAEYHEGRSILLSLC